MMRLLACLAAATALAAQDPLLPPLLRQASAEAAWDLEHALRVDLDGDGQADVVVLGRLKDRLLLAALTLPLGMGSKAQVIAFTFDPRRVTGLCTDHPVLEPESLDWDPEKTPVGELPGFTRSATAQGIKVVHGACAPYHLYWDRPARNLKYWRR
ncbi:MAG: hypothetical protein U0P81_04020 [Holophagaceae bacterium]